MELTPEGTGVPNLQLLRLLYSSFRLWAWEVFDWESIGTAVHEIPSVIAADMCLFVQVTNEDSHF